MKVKIGLIMAFCSVLVISPCAGDDVEREPMSRFVLDHGGTATGTEAEFWGSQLLFDFFDEHRGN